MVTIYMPLTNSSGFAGQLNDIFPLASYWFCCVCCRLTGIDGGDDINRDILVGIYDRTSRTPFKPAADHVTQVMKVEQMIVGKKPVSPRFHLYCIYFPHYLKL